VIKNTAQSETVGERPNRPQQTLSTEKLAFLDILALWPDSAQMPRHGLSVPCKGRAWSGGCGAEEALAGAAAPGKGVAAGVVVLALAVVGVAAVRCRRRPVLKQRQR
jgi:hypothetical protein